MLSGAKTEWKKVQDSYSGVHEVLLIYWRGYGGIGAVLRSPYFHAAVLIAVLSRFGLIMPWYDTTLSVLPNILGFAIGGYAIWLAFGDVEFRDFMTASQSGKSLSDYMDFTITFAHFVMVQIAALLCALCGKALHYDVLPDTTFGRLYATFPAVRWLVQDFFSAIGGTIGAILLVYALTSAAAAGFAILRVAHCYDEFNRLAALRREARRSANHGGGGGERPPAGNESPNVQNR